LRGLDLAAIEASDHTAGRGTRAELRLHAVTEAIAVAVRLHVVHDDPRRADAVDEERRVRRVENRAPRQIGPRPAAKFRGDAVAGKTIERLILAALRRGHRLDGVVHVRADDVDRLAADIDAPLPRIAVPVDVASSVSVVLRADDDPRDAAAGFGSGHA